MEKILNLAKPNKTQVRYEISKFPDGQQSISIEMNSLDDIIKEMKEDGVVIKSRFNSFSDLELIICATCALKNIGIKKISLDIPYCLGGRSDRKFSEGGINYIKNIISPIINMQGYEKVTIFDPHSDVLEACIDNFVKVDNISLVKFAMEEYRAEYGERNWRIVSPDAGALKKVYNAAESLGYKSDLIIASKHRDISTGRITHTEVPIKEEDPNMDFFIIDDICDGGRTFTEISSEIKKYYLHKGIEYKGNIFLIVSHGIFSSGFDQLDHSFSKIYTTDSVKDVDYDLVKQKKLF